MSRWNVIGWILVFVAGMSAGCAKRMPPSALDARSQPFLASMYTSMEQGDWAGALAWADSAATYSPGAPEIGYNRGRIYTELRQYDAAKQALDEALAADDAFPGAWYQRGHVAFLQREYREALNAYDRELAALEGGDPAAVAAVSAQIGRTYSFLGVADSARLLYDLALAADTTSAPAHAWLSELLEKEGRVEEALNHARLALQFNPIDIENGYRLGRLYVAAGKPDQALPFLSVVVRRWPGHEGATFNMGRALQAVGREEEARAYLDRVEALQQLQERATVAELGVETYPEEADRWTELAGVMMELGHWARAESALNAARALRPNDLSLQSDLASLAFTRGDTTTALRRFDALLVRDSTYADGWLNLGVVHAVSGDTAAARHAWLTALRHKPGDPDVILYLSQLGQ